MAVVCSVGGSRSPLFGNICREKNHVRSLPPTAAYLASVGGAYESTCRSPLLQQLRRR